MQSRPPKSKLKMTTLWFPFLHKTRSDESYLNEDRWFPREGRMEEERRTFTAALLSSLGKCASSWLQASRRRGPRSQQIWHKHKIISCAMLMSTVSEFICKLLMICMIKIYSTSTHMSRSEFFVSFRCEILTDFYQVNIRITLSYFQINTYWILLQSFLVLISASQIWSSGSFEERLFIHLSTIIALHYMFFS